MAPLYTAWLQSAFWMQGSGSHHPPLRTQPDVWPDAIEIIYTFKNVFNCLHRGKILMRVKESILELFQSVIPVCIRTAILPLLRRPNH